MRDENIHGMITALEERIANDPDYIEGYYRLGSLYEHVEGNDAKAKRYYLLDLVRTLGYPDDGTAVRELFKVLAGDCNNCMARINLGQIYAYRNRFDEAERELILGTRWLPYESKHYCLHTIPESTAFGEMKQIERDREDALEKICALFQVNDVLEDRIDYFFYESRVHKGLITGDQMPAHTFVEKADVHAVYGPHHKLNTPHEDVHIVLGRMGRPPKLIEEGAAEYAHHGGAAHAMCRKALASVGFPAIPGLMEDEEFAKSDLDVVYPLAASFAGFLITQYGVGSFKRLYGAWEQKIQQPEREIYGKGWDDLETEWRAFIASLGDDRNDSKV